MFSLALRNLWRNPKRSAITLSAIVIGAWALIFVWAFIDGMNEQMIANNIQYLTGHIKIHKQGYHKDKVLALSMSEKFPAAIKNEPLISVATPRVEGTALISSKNVSATVLVYGVDIALEPTVTTLHNTIVEGRYLTNKPLEIVLGDDLARELNVTVGESLDMIVQAADGSIGADRFTLVGLYNSGIDMLDERLVMIPVASAQELYSMWGQYTSWVVKLKNRQVVEPVSQQLTIHLGTEYEVYPWPKLLPSVVQAVEFHEAVAYVVLWIVFIVVAAGIANTLLMSVMERIREFGVMQALGTQGIQIIQLVLWESLLLAVIGLAIGNALGIGFTQYWAVNGIDLSAYTEAMETMPGLSAIVYPLLRQDHLLLVSLVVLIVCLLPAVFPAWRASRMDPVQSIRGIAPPALIANKIEQVLKIPSRWLWWQLAWRNLFRNPKRSYITSGASAFGMATFIFLYAFADGFFEQMITNSTQLLSSHVQIKALKEGKRETVFLSSSISQDLLEMPEIQSSSPRLVMDSMVSSPHKALPVNWIGVNPETEINVTRLQTLVQEGSYLEVSSKLGGEGVLIGRTLAEDLKVSIGHKIVVTTQDSQGQLLSTALRISGIFFSGSELFDRGYVFSSIEHVRQLFSLPEDSISHLAIRLSDRHDSQGVANRLSAALNGTQLKAQPWEQIMPVVVQMVEMTQVDFYLILAVIFVVVGMGVMNTMLMSVLERVREFGMLLALGTLPSQVLRTVLYESLILGAAGIIVGILAGLALAQYYHIEGIDLSAFMDSMAAIPGVTDRIYPVIIPSNLILPAALLYLIGVVVSIYPALKAASLQPVEALHGR